jgi:hypothetical protein
MSRVPLGSLVPGREICPRPRPLHLHLPLPLPLPLPPLHRLPLCHDLPCLIEAAIVLIIAEGSVYAIGHHDDSRTVSCGAIANVSVPDADLDDEVRS